VNAPEVVEKIRQADPAALLVVAWSQLLRAELLSIPRHGSFGMHPTALPLGRGRAPIPWTLIKGLDRSGVTLFQLTLSPDAGPIVAQEQFDVDLHDDATTLYAKVRGLYVKVLLENVDAIVSGTAAERPQQGEATAWPRRDPEDGLIDWSRPGRELYDWIRALTHPYPGAFTALPDGRRLVVWKADLVELAGASSAAPGTVLGALRSTGHRDGGVTVAAGSDAVVLRQVELDGRGEPALDLLDGGTIRTGDRLG